MPFKNVMMRSSSYQSEKTYLFQFRPSFNNVDEYNERHGIKIICDSNTSMTLKTSMIQKQDWFKNICQ